MRKRSIAVALGVLMVLWAAPAFADPMDCGEGEEAIDGMTIRYDECVQDLEYIADTSVTYMVDWMVVTTVPQATCTFQDFELRVKEIRGKGLAKGNKGHTPVSKDGPPEGRVISAVPSPSTPAISGTVAVTAEIGNLHSGNNGDVAVATGHYWMMMVCDTDGDTVNDAVARLGVNFHVCQDLTDDGVSQCEEDS